MRKVILATFVSLDGVMQAPGGPHEDTRGGFAHGGWLPQFWDDETGAFMGRLFDRRFNLLLGRRTYEIFAAHWPYQDDPIGRAFDEATKYVATRSDMPLEWKNSVRLSDAAIDVARLKQDDGPDILIQGSSVLIQSLQRAGLIDEYHVLTFPLVLGTGKRLFEHGLEPGALKLTSSHVTSKGAVLASYTPAGALESGSFSDESPSAAELERRDQWAREG